MNKLVILVLTLTLDGVFGGSEWLNRLPSVQVKVGTDGVLVKMGPSREEVYWLIAYVILGLVLFILISVAVGICIHKYCCSPRALERNSSRIVYRDPELHLQNSQRLLLPNSYPVPDTFSQRMEKDRPNNHTGVHVLPFRGTN